MERESERDKPSICCLILHMPAATIPRPGQKEAKNQEFQIFHMNDK